MPDFRSALLVTCTIASVGIATPAQAQPVPLDPREEADDPRWYLSPIVVTADALARDGDAGNRSTVGRDAIATFGGDNLDEALRATAGVFTRDSPQNPGIAVNIRGLEGSGRVVMMIDGVRQNFRFTGHEAQGFTYVDSSLLAGVDIARGGVAGVGGAGALAGSANFRTVGVDDVLREDSAGGGFATLSWGDNGAGFVPTLAGAARLGELSLLAAAAARSPSDYRNGDGEVVRDTAQDLHSGLFKLDYRPSATHRLRFGSVLYDNEFLANSYPQTIDSTQLNAGYAWTPNDPRFDLAVNLHRNDVRMRYGASPFNNGGSAQGRRIRDLGTGFDATNTWRHGDSATTVFGVEWFRDEVDTRNSTAVPDRGVNPSGESALASAFVDTTMRFGITQLSAGLRADRFSLEGRGSVTAANPLGMPAGPYSVDRSGTEVNPSATLALVAADWLQPYLRWSRSARAPTVSETFMGGDHPAEGGPGQSFFPNPFLEPEVARGWELGALSSASGLWRDADRVRAKLTLYRNAIDDYVTAQFGSGTYFGNNAGTSIVRGIELQAGYDAGAWFTDVGYTHVDSDLPSQVNGLGAQSYVPDEVMNATLGARLFARRLTFGLRWSKVSRGFIGEENAFSGDPWEPGYALVDLFAHWAFDNGLSLRANVSNLADTAYTPALSTPAGGTSVDTGRGRSLSLSARYAF
ncbi:MAG: TonB-dependent receptor [Xanthomonadales bacterium]|nr:TonB-dependent receptor [Xanthomonadales bacterium]